ncbi:hypothetical protein [Georgenia yuyongxinii]|uniref:Uncharacterized protein n=1 Tax=Georgenia yuyongxinii TaxID=2589797 RepID=A0A552WSA9_9MICO|nr:hypothetical protein [Georgenia yuyongxinii]TRW45596.1 hypothetical protein FJ693_08670 [Georgenia yuyongxinii]
MTEWIEPAALPVLQGDEAFNGIDATVADFWRFAMSDLRANAVRGLLAEFLVARAVGHTAGRVEWDSHDVTTPSGIRVEVKASGYLQSWRQRRLSRIVFSGLNGQAWPVGGVLADEVTYNADAYVFAVQTATTHATYDPLDVAQWQFYVLPAATVAGTGKGSLSLTAVRALGAEETPYSRLATSIEVAGADALSQRVKR